MSLRRLPPRPLRTREKPAYPRVLAAAAASALLVSGCALYPGYNHEDPGGDIAVPFDEDTGADTRWEVGGDTGNDTKLDSKPDTGFGIDAAPDGTAAPPFDSGEASDTIEAGPADTNDSGEVD